MPYKPPPLSLDNRRPFSMENYSLERFPFPSPTARRQITRRTSPLNPAPAAPPRRRTRRPTNPPSYSAALRRLSGPPFALGPFRRTVQPHVYPNPPTSGFPSADRNNQNDQPPNITYAALTQLVTDSIAYGVQLRRKEARLEGTVHRLLEEKAKLIKEWTEIEARLDKFEEAAKEDADFAERVQELKNEIDKVADGLGKRVNKIEKGKEWKDREEKMAGKEEDVKEQVLRDWMANVAQILKVIARQAIMLDLEPLNKDHQKSLEELDGRRLKEVKFGESARGFVRAARHVGSDRLPLPTTAAVTEVGGKAEEKPESEAPVTTQIAKDEQTEEEPIAQELTAQEPAPNDIADEKPVVGQPGNEGTAREESTDVNTKGKVHVSSQAQATVRPNMGKRLWNTLKNRLSVLSISRNLKDRA